MNKQFFLRLLPKSDFVRNIAILTSGTIVAHGIVVLALPILTRLYSPSDFSLLAVYGSVVGLFLAVSCLRFNIAIPIPKEDHKAVNLLTLSILTAGVISFLVAIPMIFAPEATAALIGQPAMQPYLWMIPVGIFLAASYDALQYWASRQKRFVVVTKTRVTRAVGGSSVQLGAGFVNPTPFGLIFGQMLYFGIGVLGLLRSMWQKDRPKFRAISAPKLVETAKEYKRFPYFSVPEALSNAASVEIPILLIAAFGPVPEAGYLMLAMRVMGMPMVLIGSSVAQVFLVEAPEKLRDGTLRQFTLKTMWALLKSGAPILVCVGIASPFLFPILFGAEWQRAGIIVAWATPWYIMQFIASPVSMVLHVMGKTIYAMWIQIFGVVLRVSVVLGAQAMAFGPTTELFALSGGVFYLLYIVMIFWIIDRTSS